MRHFFIATLFIFSPFQSYSDDCFFQGTVHPEQKTQRVKEVYTIACHFFTKTFAARLKPGITLNNILFIRDWAGVPFLDDPELDSLTAAFYHPTDDFTNNIYINETELKKTFVEDPVCKEAILFHELIHFFYKSASLEYRVSNKIERNLVMDEALSYWSQNQYIETETQGKRNLMDCLKSPEKESFVLKENFAEEYAVLFYAFDWQKFVYNAIHFMDSDPQGEYNNIVNGKYVFKDPFEGLPH